MIESIYADWLKIAPFIYLVLAAISLFAIAPEGKAYDNYRLGKKIFGWLLIFMGLYIASLGIFDFRIDDPIVAQSVNISSFYAAASLTAYLFQVLLGRKSVLSKVIIKVLTRTAILSAILLINYLFSPEWLKRPVTLLFSALLVLELVRITRIFFKHYKRVQDRADEYYSESIQPFIKWMNYSLYALIFIGFFGCTHSYFSPLVNTIYGVIAAIVLTYIVIVFRNYMTTAESLYRALSEVADEVTQGDIHSYSGATASTDCECNIDNTLQMEVELWINRRGYTTVGLTSESLAQQLCTNRTYLTNYIHDNHNVTFREWISALRIQYAKELMQSNPEMSISDISVMVGYNRSSFTKIFTKDCGMTPTAWRAQNSI